MNFSIAIDGPAGAGKSSISRAVAKTLGYLYVDTGALYRAVGYAVVQAGVDPSEAGQVETLLKNTRVDLRYVDGEQQVLVNDENVSALIRTAEMSMMASKISALPVVRAYLLETQREIARKNNIVMDGRDIGTVVLPQAQIKIYLTATPQERANRRYQEMLAKGEQVNYEDVLRDIIKRDDQDMNRPISPLRRAEDAILVDTTTSSGFEESTGIMLRVIREELKKLGAEA